MDAHLSKMALEKQTKYFTMILDLDVCMDESRMTDDSSINVEQSTL